ncbi:hypothetical protein AB0M42_10235 [Streptomyces sp. NPDC051784]|uniref:hypothetical protein n=1 Tax=Streptomyces sp. NPDC051784 TaxID=3155805 RepID=UPI00342988E3
MTATQFSAAPHTLPAAPHPMANPGYGKRSATGQHPRGDNDFSHLAPREAAIAAYIDRLPDGSDISVKTLAKALPYGQCALRTALNRLQAAGHLRRGRECVTTDELMLWVTRTFFSRTARDDEWWAAYIRGDVPREEPQQRPARSRAYILLAALGRSNPSLSLSAAECASLEPQVDEWFERGATEAELLHALTDGLPVPVHRASALIRRRLTDKLPPYRPAPERYAPLLSLECGECRAPGSPEALTGGLCSRCRGEAAPAPAGPPGAVATDGVSARIAEVRAGLVPRHERVERARRKPARTGATPSR